MKADPFTLVYDALVNAFKSAGFKVIDFNTTRNPLPDTATTSDLPELQIKPSALSAQLASASCSSEVDRSYELILNTGDLVLGKYLFPKEWDMIRVLHKLRYDGLDHLEIEGRSFVERVEIANTVTGVTNPEGNRQIVGWASIWTIAVIMSFSTKDMTL